MTKELDNSPLSGTSPTYHLLKERVSLASHSRFELETHLLMPTTDTYLSSGSYASGHAAVSTGSIREKISEPSEADTASGVITCIVCAAFIGICTTIASVTVFLLAREIVSAAWALPLTGLSLLALSGALARLIRIMNE